jgi:hypothetical protein
MKRFHDNNRVTDESILEFLTNEWSDLSDSDSECEGFELFQNGTRNGNGLSPSNTDEPVAGPSNFHPVSHPEINMSGSEGEDDCEILKKKKK